MEHFAIRSPIEYSLRPLETASMTSRNQQNVKFETMRSTNQQNIQDPPTSQERFAWLRREWFVFTGQSGQLPNFATWCHILVVERSKIKPAGHTIHVDSNGSTKSNILQAMLRWFLKFFVTGFAGQLQHASQISASWYWYYLVLLDDWLLHYSKWFHWYFHGTCPWSFFNACCCILYMWECQVSWLSSGV